MPLVSPNPAARAWDKRFLTAAFVLAATATLAAPRPAAADYIVLVDLNELAGTAGPGGFWNSYAAPANINGSAVRDSGNALTAVTLGRSGTMTDNGNFGTTVFNPGAGGAGVAFLPSWVTDANGNDDAAADNFFTSNSVSGAQSFTLTFGGFNPTDTVSVDLLAARDSGSALGFFEYSLDGGDTWAGFTVRNADGTLATADGWNTNDTRSQLFNMDTQGHGLHRYMTATSLAVTGSTLDIRTTDANTTTSTFSGMNALRLTVVPEPGSAGLLVAGLLALGGVRRRRAVRS